MEIIKYNDSKIAQIGQLNQNIYQKKIDKK